MSPVNLPAGYLHKQCVTIPPNFALVERQEIESSQTLLAERLILNQLIL